MMAEYKDCAIDIEEKDSDSFLNLYKKSLKIRKSNPGLNSNGIQFEGTKDGAIHFTRPNGFNLYSNTTNNLITFENVKGEILLKSTPEISLENGKLNLPANSTVWIQA